MTPCMKWNVVLWPTGMGSVIHEECGLPRSLASFLLNEEHLLSKELKGYNP